MPSQTALTKKQRQKSPSQGKARQPVTANEPINESQDQLTSGEKQDDSDKSLNDAYRDRQVKIAEGQLAENHKLSNLTLALVTFSGLGFFISAIGIVISIYQTRIAKQSADATTSAAKTGQDTLVVSQRPWVGPDLPFKKSDEPIFNIRNNRPLSWIVRIKNFGASPALRVKWHMKGFTTGGEIDWKRFEYTLENLVLSRDMEFTLFGGQELPNPGEINLVIGNDRLTPVITPEVMKRLNGASQALVLGGLISYSDEFGGTHKTTWCIRYTASNGYVGCPVIPIAT